MSLSPDISEDKSLKKMVASIGDTGNISGNLIPDIIMKVNVADSLDLMCS
jgi:hypothetical protein